MPCPLPPAWLMPLETLASAAALLALVQAVLLLVQTAEHARYVHHRFTDPRQPKASGPAAVFVPCKGVDPGMAENLRPMFLQDYSDYRLMFVVQSLDDPACGVIRGLMAAYRRVPARLLVAGRAVDCGQKVHNLLRATAQLEPEVRFLAFADCDVRPPTDWLRRMIERLVTRNDTGAVTGYRWLLPTRFSLAGLLLASLNNAVVTLFTSGGHHLLWGGCWAIRRERFESLGIRDAWCGVLSDDLAASRAIHRSGLRIKFEPRCVLPAAWDGDWRSIFDFLYRQHFMLWRYAPRWAVATLAGALVAVAGCWLPAVVAILGFVANGRLPGALLVLAASAYLLQVVRTLARHSVAHRYFSVGSRSPALRALCEVLVAPLAVVLALATLLAAAFSRRVRWRHVGYAVDGKGTVTSIAHNRQPRPAATGPAPLAAPANA